MTVKTGSAWAGSFVTLDATGAVTAATGTPVGTLYVDGTADAATVTITGSNPYKWSVTLPSLTAGQRVDMYITATISTIATAGFVASEQADTVLASEVKTDTAAILADTGTDGVVLKAAGLNADAVTEIQSGLALEATLTAIKGGAQFSSNADLAHIHDLVNNGIAGHNLAEIVYAIADMPTNAELATALGTADDAVLAAIAAAKTVIDNIHDTDLPAVKTDTAAVKAKTDLIPATPAEAGEYTAAIAAIPTTPLLAAGYTAPDNAGIAAIKAKTDNLPTDPADDSDIDTQLAAIKAVVDNVHDTDLPAIKAETASILEDTGTTLDGIVDAIKVKTDQLTFTTAAKVDATATATVDSSAFSTIAGNVWSHATRTLTNQGLTVTTPATGDPLEIYRDTTVTISLTGLGATTGYTKIWFTVKEDLEDLDTAAVLQVSTIDGLKYLDGDAGTATDGTLVIDNDLHTATITIQQASAALLPVYAAYPIPWDLKMLNASVVSILAEGTMYIKSTPTRTIS